MKKALTLEVPYTTGFWQLAYSWTPPARWIVFLFVVIVWLLGVTELVAYLGWGRTFISEVSYAPQNHHGPYPLKRYQGRILNFESTLVAFGNAPVHRLNELDFEKVEAMLLSTVPSRMKRDAIKVIDSALEYAEAYQVDPFWVLAVMWTESHFKPLAKSYVHAMGLMQIMPGTSHYLTNKMDRRVGAELAYQLAKEPKMNIEMGVYYLDYLLQNFAGSSRLATVAYNMGPGRVRRRLRKRLPVGVQNQYLSKVRRYYFALSKPFRQHFQGRPFPYEGTYVARMRRVDQEWRRDILKTMDLYLGPGPNANLNRIDVADFQLFDISEGALYPGAKLL